MGKRLIIFFASIALIIVQELSLAYYQHWLLFGIILILLIAGTILFANNWRFNKESLGFFLTAFLLVIGAFAFSYFQEYKFVIQTVIIVSSITFWLYVRNIHIFHTATDKYLPYSLENIANYLNIVSAFFWYVFIFCFFILSLMPLWLSCILIFIVTYALVWQTLWINKISGPQYIWAPFLGSVLISEFFWVIHYWPTSFFVNGSLLAVLLYLFIVFLRFQYANNLTRKNIFKYLIFTGSIIIIILATTQWQ